MKFLLQTMVVILCLSIGTTVHAQNEMEASKLKAEKTLKEAEIKKLEEEISLRKAELATIASSLEKALKWTVGSGGLLGLDINSFNNWAQKPDLNSSAQSISFAYNGFANLVEDKYFWRNNGGINLGWLKYDEDSQTSGDNDGFNQVADVFNVQSLFGYNLTKTLAASALGEYRTTLLSNFNDPGYLDAGVGFTWTPMPNFVMVIHPLNYNFIFASDDTNYESSLGAKIVADYNTKLWEMVTWRSNLSAFYSYKGSDLSNYTWVNGFNFNAFKGIGIGLELGLRWNPQETSARELSSAFQNYYQVGLSYTL